MSLSISAARRREYPETREDLAFGPDPEKPESIIKQKLKVPLTDTFYLTFRDPETNKYRRFAISYGQRVTRIADQDIRNFEDEYQVLPELVQKELYYTKNPSNGLWEEIKGAKTKAEHYADCTEEYHKLWRATAYKGSAEDPLKGLHRKTLDAQEFRLHLRERQLDLMMAKERGWAVPMAETNTRTGASSMVDKSTFTAGAGPHDAADIFEFVK